MAETTPGFYLDDNDYVVYMDAQGTQYYPNPHMDPADADAYGIKYVRCDEGIYYFQSAPNMPAEGYGMTVQRNSRSGGGAAPAAYSDSYYKDNYGYQQEDLTARMSSSDEEDMPPSQIDSSAYNLDDSSNPYEEDRRRSDGSHPHKRDSKNKPKQQRQQKPRRTKSSSSDRPTATSSSTSTTPSRSKSGDFLNVVEAAMNANAHMKTPQELDEKGFEKALKRESNRRKKKGGSQSPVRGKTSREGHAAETSSRGKRTTTKQGPKPPTLSRSRSTGDEDRSKRGSRAALSGNPARTRSGHDKSKRGPARALSASPTARRSGSRRNLMIDPREDEARMEPREDEEAEDHTAVAVGHSQQQPFANRSRSPRRSPSRDETTAAAPTRRGGGRPVLSRENSMKNCRRAGMARSRADRISQRNLMRQNYTAAIDHYEMSREEKEEQVKEEAAMERIKELEAQLAQVQQQQQQQQQPQLHKQVRLLRRGDESPGSRHVSPSNSAKEGLLGLANAARLVGKTAVNTTVGAGKLAANVGLATTHMAADATMLVGKTAVNTTVGAAKLTADAALATTHMAADATLLVGKTAVNTTVEAAKMTADAAKATTNIAADAMTTTVGAAVAGATTVIAQPLRTSELVSSKKTPPGAYLVPDDLASSSLELCMQ